MHTIYKYPLRPNSGVEELEIEGYIEVLSCKVQDNQPVLYVAINTEHSVITTLKIHKAETGKALKTSLLQYIGTCMLDSGKYVLHIFLERC